MRPLGELEAVVMESVWTCPGASVREVADRIGAEAPRAYTTVMTTLDRLHKKGLLHREKDGLAWRYRPAHTREGFERQVADALAAELLSRGETGLAALVDATADEALLDRLAALIATRRRDA